MLFVDADEFWLPASGSLHDLRDLADADVLTVRRYNVALGPDGPLIPPELPTSAYEDALLWARPTGGCLSPGGRGRSPALDPRPARAEGARAPGGHRRDPER